MSSNSELIVPLKNFFQKVTALREAEFVAEFPGPFMLTQLHQEASYLVNLGEVDRPFLVLGRSDRNDLVYANSNVSSGHARLEKRGSAWFFTDLGSTNGTKIQEQPIPPNAPHKLESGQKIFLADVVRLQFFNSADFHKLFREGMKRRQTQRIKARKPSKPTRVTRRLYRSRTGHPRKVMDFATDIQRMEPAQFFKYFPCPFLIQLVKTPATSTEPYDDTHLAKKPTAQSLEDTQLATQLPLAKTLKDLSYWPIASTQKLNKMTVGRTWDSDLIIDHPTISRLHALFYYDPQKDQWRIENKGSLNGILVDGEYINEPHTLTDEVCLRFGREVLVQFMTPKTFYSFLKNYSLATQLR
ncbi:MAG: FHA domain-containing protein [Planctomycetota bacterium]|nr:FHA domain-containing protein [Planctomycetota bacterium]